MDESPTSVEHAMQMLREAIALVASGGASRVVVASIPACGRVVEPGSRLALAAGVRLRPLPRAVGDDVDLAVESLSE
jgi:hypothetical protein